MIVKLEIIPRAFSDKYAERVYQNGEEWNPLSCTCVKFTNHDHSEWCGKFGGFAKRVLLSQAKNMALVLTSDHLFQLELNTGNLTDIEDEPQYQNLAIAPNGDVILADYYNFQKFSSSINTKTPIESPIRMDNIDFKKWDGSKLEFTCEEILCWDRHLTMTYDSETNKIEIKDTPS